ncbi:hypothetical protein [Mangrovimonas sp. DI 80]|uniref:hypothetical protein n=1 Tax=Mangrovimonas sp. DI 80 TaxID=1779330 RepID=UPI0009CD0508|nr:hypothetical protein [Mangrovimonas sp. DI 80]OMP31718.1 hypothetical protein BKM32_01225 [Mangrovimonas sp. DI 80]
MLYRFRYHFIAVFLFKTSLCAGQNLPFGSQQDPSLGLARTGMLLDSIGIYHRIEVSYSAETTLTEFSALKRIPLSNTFSFLIGTKLDIYDALGTGNRSFGINASAGFEYMPNDNLYLNLIYSYRFNELLGNVYHYNTFDKNSLKMNLGIKF